MNVIILGDKYEKGTKSKGCSALIKFNSQYNIFEHQYECIKDNSKNNRIIYVYGFDNKRFVNFTKEYKDVVSIYNKHYDDYNYGYSLSLAKEYLDNNTLIIFGNTILNSDSLQKINKAKSSRVFINTKNTGQLGCVLENDIVKNICFELDNCVSNIYFINQQDSLLLKQLVSNSRHTNCFIFELINKLIDNGSIFHTLGHQNKIKNYTRKKNKVKK
jgi:CTP:phosphocholine cytidylyltransferase-like protein